MAAKRCMFFVAGTMNSHFFVLRQIGIKFGQKHNRCSLLNLNKNSEILKIFPWGDFASNRHFWVNLTDLRVTGLMDYFFST